MLVLTFRVKLQLAESRPSANVGSGSRCCIGVHRWSQQMQSLRGERSRQVRTHVHGRCARPWGPLRATTHLRRVFDGLVEVVQLQVTGGPVGIERWTSGVESNGQTVGVDCPQVVLPHEALAGEKTRMGVAPVRTRQGGRRPLLCLVFQPVWVPLWLLQLLQLCIVCIHHTSRFSLSPQPLQGSHTFSSV